MNYGLNQALAKIRPADKSADRFAKQQDALVKLKDTYTSDMAKNSMQEALYSETIGALDKEVALLSESGQEEMQAIVQDKKKFLETELGKHSSMSHFMRAGGTRLLGEYKNGILSDQRFLDHQKSSESLNKIQQLMEEGHGDKISYTTQADMQRYKNGLIDRFEPILINPIPVPEDKYIEDVGIALESMVAENWHAFVANFIAENPDIEPSIEKITEYARQYYGEALGKRKDYQERAKAAAQAKSSAKVSKEDYNLYSRNVVNAFSSLKTQGSIEANKDGSLKEAMFKSGYNYNIPFDFQRRVKLQTETGNLPAEMYEMNKVFGGSVWTKVANKTGKDKTDDGTYNFGRHEIFDENGIYGGGVDSEDENQELNGKYLGVYMVKGNENISSIGEGSDNESVIFMKNADKDKQATQEMSGGMKGYGMLVAAFRDSETGEVFYSQIPSTDAAAAGTFKEVFGEADKITDDIKAEKIRVMQEQSIKNIDAQKMSNINTVYQTDYRNDIQESLKIRNLDVGTDIYGAYIATMTQIQMGLLGPMSAQEYDAQWRVNFDRMQKLFANSLDSDKKFRDLFANHPTDGDAKRAITAYLIEDTGGDDSVKDLYLKYINSFRNN